MRVLLVSDVWPNLALGRYAAYHKLRGDEVYRSCNNPDRVICSWSFSRSIAQSHLWDGAEVVEGGAFTDPHRHLPSEIEALAPDLGFLGIDYALGRRTVGCPNQCPWCRVPRIWGNRVREHEALDHILQGRDKVMLLDDNIMAHPNCVEYLHQIKDAGIKVCFQSGLDARLITDDKAEALSEVDYRARNWSGRYVYVAFDDTRNEKQVKRGVDILQSHGIKLMAYALAGYPNGDEFDDLFYRCDRLIEWGVDPYVMPYKTASRRLRDLDRCIDLRLYRKKGLKKAWHDYCVYIGRWLS